MNTPHVIITQVKKYYWLPCALSFLPTTLRMPKVKYYPYFSHRPTTFVSELCTNGIVAMYLLLCLDSSVSHYIYKIHPSGCVWQSWVSLPIVQKPIVLYLMNIWNVSNPWLLWRELLRRFLYISLVHLCPHFSCI